MRNLLYAALAVSASSLLYGCGGGSSSPAAVTPPPPVAVTGVDTPKSIAVVTAN